MMRARGNSLANDNALPRRKLTSMAGFFGKPAEAPVAPPFPGQSGPSAQSHVMAYTPRLMTPNRMIALGFFGVAALLSLLALQLGLAALETGLLCVLTTVAAWFVYRSLPGIMQGARECFALAMAGFASLAAIILLPAFDLWPAGAGPLVVSLVFAFVGTLIRSKLCLAVSVAALFGLMIDSDGLTRMRLDGQLATLCLFAIGLCGSVLAGSRLIAGITLVGVMVSALTLLAAFGVPSTGSLSILAVLAVATAIALRAYLAQGYGAAEIPMILSSLVFALCAVALQLFLIGEVSAAESRLAEPMPAFGVGVLIAIQGLVLFVSIIGWFSRRITLVDAVLTQALFGLVCTILADPTRLARLHIGEPAIILAILVGLATTVLAGLALYRSWQSDQPIPTALAALVLMVEIVVALRIAMGAFDIALAVLISAGLAVALAVLMALNPRHVPHTRLS